MLINRNDTQKPSVCGSFTKKLHNYSELSSQAIGHLIVDHTSRVIHGLLSTIRMDLRYPNVIKLDGGGPVDNRPSTN